MDWLSLPFRVRSLVEHVGGESGSLIKKILSETSFPLGVIGGGGCVARRCFHLCFPVQ
jgi:hypothetical protein